MVPFDKEATHAYIKDKYVANPRKLDHLIVQLAKGIWDHDCLKDNIF